MITRKEKVSDKKNLMLMSRLNWLTLPCSGNSVSHSQRHSAVQM